MKRGKLVIKPDFVKDKKIRRIIGLLLFPLSVPLIFFIIFIFMGSSMDIKAATATFTIGLYITLALYAFSFYGIASTLSQAVIITDDKFIVRRGLIIRKTIPLNSLKTLDFQVRTKGFPLAGPNVAGGGQPMAYEVGIVTYSKNGRQRELKLPYGFYYLKELGKELKSRLGNKIIVHSKNFEYWEKWYKTSFIKKAAKVVLVIFFILVYIGIPVGLWTWLSWKFNIYNFNTPWENQTLSQQNSFAFGGLAVFVGWIILSFLILKFIDLFRKKKGKKV